MPVKPDIWIKKMASERGIISPFEPELVRDGKISFGVSSYGYDFRLGCSFKKPVASASSRIDPKNISESAYRQFESEKPFYIKPNSMLIAQSLESFNIPRSVIGICFGKSTYARMGLLVNITPLEPEWAGILTFPLINSSSHPIKVYPLEGIAQVVFIASDAACKTSYADRKGKYQNQSGITLARA